MARTKDTARGGRVKERREAAGLTQAALARMMDAHERTVQEWEAGYGIPAIKLPLLAHALKTTAEYIRGETDDPTGDVDLEKRLARLEALAGALADDRVSGEQSAQGLASTRSDREATSLHYEETWSVALTLRRRRFDPARSSLRRSGCAASSSGTRPS
jgi:transcriptional regulator with XRE-family HTH domain